MTKHHLKPLALTMAVSLALSLSACGKQDSSSTTTPANASTAPAAASTVAAADLGKSIFDVSELGDSALACQDFNGFVNAKWVAANPIPEDRTRWGAFDQLAEASLNTQHDLADKAAKGAATATAGSIEQKIGYLYQSGMDEAAIEKAGFDPIKPKLDAIAGLKNGSDVADYITKSYVDGDGQVFAFGSGADFQHADMQIAYANEAGLGLPTKDYYSDAKYKDIRDAYVAYIAKALQLTGVSEPDAK
jgi:putative endopeptidase